MKITKTEINHKVNESSSWIVYICKTEEDAMAIHQMCRTQRYMLCNTTTSDWYYTVSTAQIINDCRVPEFFHNRGYWVTVVEHNNGDWDSRQTYTLYIVD